MVYMETIRHAKRSISGLESHLGYWLRRVSNTVSGEFARSLHARQTSVAEWVLLRHLYERQQVTPGELAEASKMTRGAISKIIDKLQAKGWIKSRINPEDNRAQLLSLTPVGRRNLPELSRDRRSERRAVLCLSRCGRKICAAPSALQAGRASSDPRCSSRMTRP